MDPAQRNVETHPLAGSARPIQAAVDVSVVVPIYNERDNLLPLHSALTWALRKRL